ncbi:hypothetical protein COCOBI_05-0100 [Coccomyxa sp. Obi]|nr:hypothetical protein COCOBI_05-0100 [Coccomyxa sp. Obi]
MGMEADKLQHFLSCGLISAIAFISASLYQKSHYYRLHIGALAGFVAGFVKELGDYLQWWPGVLSLKDAGADVAGTATCLLAVVVRESFSILPRGSQWRWLPAADQAA